jgi:hypothetical protein
MGKPPPNLHDGPLRNREGKIEWSMRQKRDRRRNARRSEGLCRGRRVGSRLVKRGRFQKTVDSKYTKAEHRIAAHILINHLKIYDTAKQSSLWALTPLCNRDDGTATVITSFAFKGLGCIYCGLRGKKHRTGPCRDVMN